MADRITTSRIALSELPSALSEILTEYQSANFETRQEALQAGAEVFKSSVESVTPRDTGEMARSWQIKDKYKDRRYVGNTRVATGKVRRKKRNGQKGEAREGVPLSNVLEYGEKARITALYVGVLIAPNRRFLRQSKIHLKTEAIINENTRAF